MKYLFIFMLLCLIFTVNASDLTYLYAEYNSASACQYYELNSDIDLNSIAYPEIVGETKVYGELGACTWTYIKDYLTWIDVPVYDEKITFQFDEKAGNNTELIERTVKEVISIPKVITEEKTDFKEINLIRNTPKQIKLCCTLRREYVKDRGYVIEYDIIPKVDGVVYDKYAWFNDTYENRTDIINDTYSLPTWINGTGGYNGINIITNSWGNSNNLTQYENPGYTIAANDTDSWGFETENGGANYSICSIYNKGCTGFLSNNTGIAALHFGINKSADVFNSATETYNGVCSIANCNYTNGLKGQGFQTDGGTDVRLFQTDAEYFYNAFSVVLWVYPYSATQWSSTVGNFMRAEGSPFVMLGYNTDQLDFECGAGNAQPMSSISEQKWYMLTMACEMNKKCNAYINDSLLSTFDATTDYISIKNIVIGDRYLGDQPLNGAIIDEVLIFSRNLTQADVEHLVKSGLGNSEYMYGETIDYDNYTNGTTTTTTTLPPGCNLAYRGNKQLCLYDVNNTETCLNASNSSPYQCDQDYKLLLKEIPSSVNRIGQVYTETLPGTLLLIGLALVPISLIIYIVYRLILK